MQCKPVPNENIKYIYLFMYTPTMSTNGNPIPSAGGSDTVPETTNPAQSSEDGSSTVTESGKRGSYLSWEEYFMAVAFLSSKCSKDPKTQVGACIVNEDKKIVGIGYNTMPNGCEEIPWSDEKTDDLDDKHNYVCYAARHAVLNCNRPDLKNCSLYTSVFPSNECAKVLIQAHVKEVIYFSDKYASQPQNTAAKRMFDKAKITPRKYSSPRTKINIKFQNCVDLNEKGERGNGSAKKPRRQLDWGSDKFFMAMAFLTGQRSKDPKTQVGACIVNEDNQIVSVGYNSMPVGCDDSDMPWLADSNMVDSKRAYVCHAELNAVMNRNCASLKGCRIYVTLYPCNECAKILIQSGIKEIVYFNDKKENGTVPIPYQASARMFRAVSKGKERIIIRKHDPDREELPLGEINFDDFDALEETREVSG